MMDYTNQDWDWTNQQHNSLRSKSGKLTNNGDVANKNDA